MGKLHNLHYLRGVAALLVVFLHYNFVLPEYAQKYVTTDGVGVDTFFIISGFIITYATQKKESVTEFAVKRLFRIYPLFIVVWFIASLTIYSNASWKDLIKSLLLFHNDYNYRNAPAYGFNLMGTPWTLTYEIYFYTIFCVSMAISQKYRVAVCSAIILIIVAGMQLIFNHEFSFSSQMSAKLYISEWWMVPTKILSTTVLFEFIAGMLIAKAFMQFNHKPGKSTTCYILLTCLFVIISVVIIFGFGPVGLFGSFWVALPLLIATVCIDKYGPTFKSSFLNNAGNISYSLYIIHFPVMTFFRQYFFEKHQLTDTQRFICFSLMIALCYIAANIAHTLIEKPAIKLSRKICMRFKAPPLNFS